MNKTSILTAEYVIAISFVSWGAVKHGFWPWPPTLVKISAAFLIFGVLSMAAPEISAALSAGMLLALFLKTYQNGLSNYRGGIPYETDKGPYYGLPLEWKQNAG
jgi:hypothetical protein